jgi:hypothetical protein
MPYTIIKRAIETKESLTANYQYYVRHFSPQALGDDRRGIKMVTGFQYGGGRAGGLPPGGDWCFFEVDRLTSVQPNQDRWMPGRPLTVPPICSARSTFRLESICNQPADQTESLALVWQLGRVLFELLGFPREEVRGLF